MKAEGYAILCSSFSPKFLNWKQYTQLAVRQSKTKQAMAPAQAWDKEWL